MNYATFSNDFKEEG